MGWASGSELAEEVWSAIRDYIPTGKRREVAERLIEAFENQDCDTMQECTFYGLVYRFDKKTEEYVKRDT